MSSCSSSECSFEAFEPRQSLWKLVQEFLPLEEQGEIKEILGEDIIDETADLHQEVLALLEIWQDYRDESEKKNKELSLSSHYQRLPEPPEMRGNLKKEIQLFVTALKQRSVENGSIESMALSQREKNIVEYAFTKPGNNERLLSRPATALSSNSGRCTPCRPLSSSGGSRSSSSLSDVMESFQDQLNVEDVDQLTDRLRNILQEEKQLLLEDIAFLQKSLFEESHFVDNREANYEDEPSLQELKDLGMKLEKEMTMKGTSAPIVRNSSYLSPPRRPARPRTFIRSSSSPNTVLEKPSKHQDKKRLVASPLHSEAESISPAPPTHGKLKRSVSDALPLSAVSRDSDSSSSTAVVIRKSGTKSMSPSPSAKSTGSESLSPSPPTSAAGRKAGSASRFRKVVLGSRHNEQ